MSQYYGGSYDGGGGGSSPFGGNADSPGGAAKQDTLSHSIRSVTIKQLHAARQVHGDAPWTIEGMSIVAQLVSIKAQATNTVYYLDDGTGRIEARRWRDAFMDTAVDPNNQITPDSWVHITGILKMYNDKRHLNHITVHAVTDYNQIWFHQVDVITSTLTLEKMFPAASKQAEANERRANHSQSTYNARSIGNGVNDEYAHPPAMQRAVVNPTQRNQPEEGQHVGNIAQQLHVLADELFDYPENVMEYEIDLPNQHVSGSKNLPPPVGRPVNPASSLIHRSSTTTSASRDSPLARFFKIYEPTFHYNPKDSATENFRILCRRKMWDRERKEKRSKEHEDARAGYRNALVQQFNATYGTDVDSLESWQMLCEAVGIEPTPDTLDECQEAIDGVHVNLVDLVDAHKDGPNRKVRLFASEQELSDYTRKHGKFFPKETAYHTGLLQYLLRHILNPSENRGR